MQANVFSPQGNTVNIAVGATTGNVAITSLSMSQGALRLVNSGTQVVFVKLGTSNSVTAALTDFPILANTTAIIDLPPGTTYIAAIAGATGSTLYATSGISQ